MTPEQIVKWKRLVEVARWGMSEHKSVIVDLSLLQAVEQLLLDKIPGWGDQNFQIITIELDKYGVLKRI